MAAQTLHEPFTIARLAHSAGVNVETVRYYQRKGLIQEPPRPPGGVRRYSSEDAQGLRFIKRAQAMGFTLAEIGNLLKLRTHQSCHATREIAATKIQLIDQRIQELRRLRGDLARVVADCDSNREDHTCPAIERLAR